MGKDSVRTDFMDKEEFQRRAREQKALGYAAIGETIDLPVVFDPDFDQFAANTAFALRHLVVYRSDGGHFARGLVRQTGQLALIHKHFVDASLAKGNKILLAARLFRRAHPTPGMHWMMAVQFAIQVMNVENETIHASPEVTEKADHDFADYLMHHIRLVVENPQWSGDRQVRLREWVNIAERLGYPKYLDLWYYNRVATFEYVNWNTKDPRRVAMTTATGGNLPFDGTTGGLSHGTSFSAPPGTAWRNYPFKKIFEECKHRRDVNDYHGLISHELIFAEDEVLRSIAEIAAQIKRVSAAGGLDFSSNSGRPSDNLGPLASKYLQDYGKRLNDPNSLYAIYLKTSKASTSWADNW